MEVQELVLSNGPPGVLRRARLRSVHGRQDLPGRHVGGVRSKEDMTYS